MPEGTVKWFNIQKGYGFIAQDNGPDLFVHYSNINTEELDYKTVTEGDRVRFEMEQSDRGPRAIGVEVITDETVVAESKR